MWRCPPRQGASIHHPVFASMCSRCLAAFDGSPPGSTKILQFDLQQIASATCYMRSSHHLIFAEGMAASNHGLVSWLTHHLILEGPFEQR